MLKTWIWIFLFQGWGVEWLIKLATVMLMWKSSFFSRTPWVKSIKVSYEKNYKFINYSDRLRPRTKFKQSKVNYAINFNILYAAKI